MKVARLPAFIFLSLCHWVAITAQVEISEMPVCSSSSYLHECRGTKTYPDGSKYMGKWVANKRHGLGALVFPDGDKYEGEFKDDRLHGQGVYTTPDGRKYVGEFKNDQFSGSGTYTWRDGRRYVGDFRNDKFNGHGTLSYPDGSKYVGEFQDDRRNGYGLFISTAGKNSAGYWRNDSLTSPDQMSSTGLSTSLIRLKLDEVGGTFELPVKINDEISLRFVLDSGASDVTIPLDVFLTLRRTGTIKDYDLRAEQTYVLADGTTTKERSFVIRSLAVGGLKISNVSGSVTSPNGTLLLGQSFLKRFKSWSVDNVTKELILSP